MQNVINDEEDILEMLIFNPMFVYNGGSLSKALNEMYDNDLYPMILSSDSNHPIAHAMKPFLPPFISEVNYLIVPMRYTKEFIA